MSITVPNVPALAGLAIYCQACLFRSAGPMRFTNSTIDVMLR